MCPLFGKRYVADMCASSTLQPWEEQYPLGSNFCPLLEYIFQSWFEVGSGGVEFLDARFPCSAVVERCPNFFIRAFLACDVASFVVRWAIWLDSSDIVFVISATDVLSDCVAVARFASTRVWSFCVSVKSSALAYAACMFSAYPLVFEVLDDLQVSLKDPSEVSLEVDPCFITTCFARPLSAIILVYPAFFNVCVCHRNNLSWRIRILHG